MEDVSMEEMENTEDSCGRRRPSSPRSPLEGDPLPRRSGMPIETAIDTHIETPRDTPIDTVEPPCGGSRPPTI